MAGNRVLIVDGHATRRRLLADLLISAWGMRVADTASPDAAALRWIREGTAPFDVVLLDRALTDAGPEAIRATPGGRRRRSCC